jgi:hypothetical protein
VNAADSPPFDSLEAMKARHKELLRTVEKEETVDTVRARVLEFLARGTATGLVLDNPGDRRVAQGLIDYWKATLYTQLRGEVEPSAPSPTETVLKEFPEDDSVKLAAAAEGAVAALAPEDRDVARQILQRLVRLEPAVREFHSVAAPRASLDELGNVGQVVRVVHALESAGVIRSVPAPVGDTQIELAAAHLVRTWPRYADWLKDRLAFRTAAYLWQQHDRLASGLLSGRPLAEAAAYRDLDAVEGDFQKSSRRREAHMQRVRTRGAFLFLALIILGLIVVVVLLVRSINAERNLKQFKYDQPALIKRFTDINRLVRALSDIVVAEGDYDRLAQWRWEDLKAQLGAEDVPDSFLEEFLREQDSQIARLMKAEGMKERGPIALDIAHDLRDRSLAMKSRETEAMLKSVRALTYRTADRVVTVIVAKASEGKTYAEVGAYWREFWRLYWGALGMVESREVEAAMIRFGKALDAWEEEWKRKMQGGPSESVKKQLSAAAEPLLALLRAERGVEYPFTPQNRR